MHYKSIVKMFSSVGGGPHARMAQSLQKHGIEVSVHEVLSPEQWRALCGRGKLGRLFARALTFGVFPLMTLAEACKASIFETSGRPLHKPMLVVTTNPFFLPHLMTAAKPIHRCGVIPLLYDMYPDALEAADIDRPLVSRIMSAANRFMIKHADGIVHIGDMLRESAETRYGRSDKTWVIQTGGSRAEFASVHGALDPALSEWMKDRCIFSYVGNMGLMHDVETLEKGVPAFLESLSEQERRHVGIIIAATGPGEARLRKSWQSSHGDNIRFIGPLPDAPWADLLIGTDISLATLTPQAHATSIPSKVQSALAAGCIPLIVAPENSDIANLVMHGIKTDQRSETDSPCGFAVVPGDVDGLVEAMTILTEPAARQRFREAAGKTALALDVDTLAERWIECFESTADDAPIPWATAAYHFAKRLFDIAAAGAGLVLIWPVLAGTALAVRLHLGTPVLFRQKRPGLDGKPFELLKFRSMKNAPEGTDAAHDGERLTPFGKKIRALSIDELPTLLNVLKGDMSLVGPRPLLMAYLERYNDEQIKRQWAKPGVTGWAQVNGRNALEWDEKFKLDTWYAEHASVMLDLKILFKTIFTVLNRSGISHSNSATMPEFMGNQK